MEARELRIGNWVFDSNNSIEREIQNIFTPQELWEIEELKAMQPIPLTEEWLLKFGFESYSTHVNYNELQIKNKKPNKHIVVRLGIQNKYFSVFNHSECDFTELQFIRQLDFVHQLQNLYFALTGEELTINE